jgi:prepilin-type N-terminal cleavage/methylation domain-containing protein
MKRLATINASNRRRRGFTLAEVLVCALLLALGFVALVAAFGHEGLCTQRAEDVTLATFLADEIRDMALQMNFAQVFNLGAQPFNPAVLSTGDPAGLTGWAQHVTVRPVSATNLNQQVAQGVADAAQLTVEVRRNSKPVIAQTYYIFKMDGVPFTDSGT